jgi:hypothetical protein
MTERAPSVEGWGEEETEKEEGQGVQEFRSSGVQEFRSSGVQEFRSSGVQDKADHKMARKFSFEVSAYDPSVPSRHGFRIGNKKTGDFF